MGNKEQFKLAPFDFELKLGEITGVVGENGAGKSTALKIAAGELLSDTGEINYPQFPVEPMDWPSIKSHIAYIPQKIRNWKGEVRDNLIFTARMRAVEPLEAEREADSILERLGLTQYKNYFWDEMSGGYQMRMELARMLVWRPRLLILDEPLANLDIKTQGMFLKDLREISLTEKYKMAVAVSSQHLYQIENVADRLIFIQKGKVAFNDASAAVGAERKHNTFEFSADASLAVVKSALAKINAIRVDDQGENRIVFTPMQADAEVVLRCLMDNGIKVKYFRDISQSTRTFFEEAI